MALHRIRARMRFTKTSGLAGWTQAQMGVRHGQAVHINEGLANKENKRNEVIDDGDHEIIVCDLPLADLAAAEDAFATLTDANVLGRSLAFNGIEPTSSWVEHHICHHDETPPRPCEVVRKRYGD